MVADLLERVERRFYGKYRGVVVDNNDPVTSRTARCASPACSARRWSAAGPPRACPTAVPTKACCSCPDVGAGVWVEFEEGDLEFPIWTGTYWSKSAASNEVPRPQADGTAGAPQSPPTRKILKTAKGHTVQFEDAAGTGIHPRQDGMQRHRITLDGTGIDHRRPARTQYRH